MKITSLFVACLLLAMPTLSWAESAMVVRVEVIVFQHVEGRADRWPVRFSDRFGMLVDPLERARLAAWTARFDPQADPAGQVRAGQSAESAHTPVAQGRAPAWPEFYIALPSLSVPMQQALGRLQDSSRHRVLTSLAWLQPLERDRATLPVRVRGSESLAIDWTDTRPTDIFVEPPIEPPPAMPEIRYRLDGSLHVRQRQFRHVDLDLRWSEPAPVGQLAPRSEHDLLVHRLFLSRPIGLDRLEYFDSPWLGVLVRVAEWQRGQPGTIEGATGAP